MFRHVCDILQGLTLCFKANMSCLGLIGRYRKQVLGQAVSQ